MDGAPKAASHSSWARHAVKRRATAASTSPSNHVSQCHLKAQTCLQDDTPRANHRRWNALDHQVRSRRAHTPLGPGPASRGWSGKRDRRKAVTLLSQRVCAWAILQGSRGDGSTCCWSQEPDIGSDQYAKYPGLYFVLCTCCSGHVAAQLFCIQKGTTRQHLDDISP